MVVKARQLGVSWLLAAYALWTAMYRDGATVLELSQGQAEAYELLGKSRDIWDHLDLSVRVPLETDSAGELGFVGGGRILALPATQRAGRSYTATLVIADEAAFHPWAQQNYVAYKPTLDGGGQLLMVSTAKGAAGFFHDMYWASERGETPYRARFIPWHARPGRDAAWLERERSSFKGLPGEFAQEYPATAAEAFVAHSGLVYGMDTSGVPIFDRGRNVKPATTEWRDYKWRLGGADPGGQDPTAVLAVGVTEQEHIHVHTELMYQRGATSNFEIAERIFQAHKLAPFDFVVSDPSNTTLVNDFRRLGLPAYPADNSKSARIAAVTMLLKLGRLTIDPRCTNLIHEFETYYWAQRRDGGLTSGNAVATTTPADHHADGLDVLGYICLAILNGLPQHTSRSMRVEVRR